MIDTKLHALLDEFVANQTPNLWLNGSYLRVYLRNAERVLPIDPEALRPVIDIGGIGDSQERHQLRGVFPAFMDHLESKGLPIYIQNVLYPQLCWYFDRRGYKPVPHPYGEKHFYRMPT